MRQRFIAAIAVLLLAATPLPAQTGKSFMWKVEGEGGSAAYLLGSLHVLTPEWYPLNATINKAFTGSKVLVEAAGLLERPITTALRAAGYDVRQCGGPMSGRREPCPLLSGGRCRLADEADHIVFLLPESDARSHAVLAAHVSDRSDRLGAGFAPNVH